MVADLHFFPFYAKDWLAGDATSLMKPEQEGAFIRLLAIAWTNEPPCTLPDDDAYLAARSRLGARWAKLGPLVRAQFQPTEDGRLRNPRQHRIWLEQQAKHDKRVRAGSSGGRAKAEASHSNAVAMLEQTPSNATRLLEQCSTNQNQSQSKKETTPRAARGAVAPWMGRVREIWTRRYGGQPPKQAVAALRPCVTAVGADEVVARLERYVAETDARFVNLHRFAATIGEWAASEAPVIPMGNLEALDVIERELAARANGRHGP